MNKARQFLRRQLSRIGTIRFGVAVKTCAILNMSIKGATVMVWSHFGIPDRFTLVIGMSEGERLCSVIWRREKRIGVIFL